MQSQVDPNRPLAHCSHLITVCCHAIYLGGPTHGALGSEWLIEPFQEGETSTFMEHAKAGIEALARDPSSILVFSGGPTKRPKTNLSEAESYLNLTKENNLFSHSTTINPTRLITEEHATDSYQNVLFSIIRFKKHTGSYPQRVTVVTHEFKRKRFMECHFPAVGLLPATSEEGKGQKKEQNKVALIGINPPEDVTAEESLNIGEKKGGLGLWRKDLYGVGPALAHKRARRGWQPGMEETAFANVDLGPVVEELVRWNGGESGNDLFPRMRGLPWYGGA